MRIITGIAGDPTISRPRSKSALLTGISKQWHSFYMRIRYLTPRQVIPFFDQSSALFTHWLEIYAFVFKASTTVGRLLQ
jgi:hypothetical protein